MGGIKRATRTIPARTVERSEEWCRTRQTSQNAVGTWCTRIEHGPVCAGGSIFGVARHRVLQWLADQVEQVPSLGERLRPTHAGDMLELDEVWACV